MELTKGLGSLLQSAEYVIELAKQYIEFLNYCDDPFDFAMPNGLRLEENVSYLQAAVQIQDAKTIADRLEDVLEDILHIKLLAEQEIVG